ISPGDALCAFQIYLNGGTPPSGDCDNECALYAADVNCTPNGITPGDALYIFQAYLNGQTPPLDCDPTLVRSAPIGNENFAVKLVRVESASADEITVALEVDAADGLQAFGLNVGYADDVLKFSHVNAGELTECWQALDGQESVAGVVSIGGFNDEALESASGGYLATITFKVLNADAQTVELWLFNPVNDFTAESLSRESFQFSLTPTSVRRIDSADEVQSYSLEQNYPNPFNMETEIFYQLPEAVHVTLAIYNSTGQLVRTLVSKTQEAGRYSAHWNGKGNNGVDLPSGVYIYKLTTSTYIEARKLVLIK
ncbi:MAG: FlgD immunoglobulin-like domain containing protein, partial [bacterium]|nr:FlgD immunoglobulin-like domain containing protein [bacterium]